ncbi:Protein of unknown function [Cotesia congregata]|uniref:Uncharacterized protein n=1 Tax=Cotesia congregata TaxID=51543 RepID=A0A8J2MPR7_COTCN|nr:Protein of unknown function [Cotesia congregata]
MGSNLNVRELFKEIMKIRNIFVELLVILNNEVTRRISYQYARSSLSDPALAYQSIGPGSSPAYTNEYFQYLSVLFCSAQEIKRVPISKVYPLPCGNVGRARKGFKDWSCRLCGEVTENLEHIFSCSEIMKLQKERVVEYISSWKGEKLENELRWPIIEMLRGPVIFFWLVHKTNAISAKQSLSNLTCPHGIIAIYGPRLRFSFFIFILTVIVGGSEARLPVPSKHASDAQVCVSGQTGYQLPFQFLKKYPSLYFIMVDRRWCEDTTI